MDGICLLKVCIDFIMAFCLNFTFLGVVLLQLLFLFVIPASLYVKVLSFITSLQDDSSCEHKDQLWLCMSCHQMRWGEESSM